MSNSSDLRGWLPIETAPKDGTVILLYVPEQLDFCKYEIGFWYESNFGGSYKGWRSIKGEMKLTPAHWKPLEPPL